MATGALQRCKEKLDKVKQIVSADRKGWLICLEVIVITAVRMGIVYSFGSFVVNFKDLFPDMTLTEQNYIGLLPLCISMSCAPISVWLIRSFGRHGIRIGELIGTVLLTISSLGSSFVGFPNWLFLTYSFLYGVGCSTLFMATSLIIADYFPKDHKYHVLATSSLMYGYPIGSLVFNPIYAWLVDSYGFRTAFRCSAVLVFITGIVCCWNFSARETESLTKRDDSSPVRNRNAETVDNEEQSSRARDTAGGADEEQSSMKCCTCSEICQRPEILLWYIGNAIIYIGCYMPFVNLDYYMEIKGIPLIKGSLVLTALSVSECIAYIVASFLGDYFKGRLVYINVIASGCLALISIVWPFIDINYALILVLAIGMGAFLGLNVVYSFAASAEVTRLPIDVAWSWTNMWSGIAILLGPLCSGKIYDVTGSFKAVFLTLGGVYVLATLAFGAIPLIQRRRERLDGDPLTSDSSGATRLETISNNIERSASQSSLRQLPPTVGGDAVAFPGETSAINELNGYGVNDLATLYFYGLESDSKQENNMQMEKANTVA